MGDFDGSAVGAFVATVGTTVGMPDGATGAGVDGAGVAGERVGIADGTPVG